jgi:hypothetical protein
VVKVRFMVQSPAYVYLGTAVAGNFIQLNTSYKQQLYNR